MNLSKAAWRRILPFALFMAWLAVRGQAADDGRWGIDARWIYGLSVLSVGALLWVWRRDFGELTRQNLPTAAEALHAVIVGLVVFGLWIVLIEPWMIIGEPTARFLPLDGDGRLLWPLIAVRWIGAALLVPVMEELFWRSFLMRWIDSPRFESVDPTRVSAKALMLSTFVFMLAHPQWLAAVIAGLAYAWLYRRRGRLWAAVLAHATTNAALGVHVVTTRQWQFW